MGIPAKTVSKEVLGFLALLSLQMWARHNAINLGGARPQSSVPLCFKGFLGRKQDIVLRRGRGPRHARVFACWGGRPTCAPSRLLRALKSSSWRVALERFGAKRQNSFHYQGSEPGPRGELPAAGQNGLVLGMPAKRFGAKRQNQRARKFLSSSRPESVSTLSGWNCTPSTGKRRWRSPMITRVPSDSRASALTSSSAGRPSSATISE